MPHITLGHRLSRELARRGNRRAFFRPNQYRELRRIDSVDELAAFLDRTGYRHVRALANIDEVADDMVIESNAPAILDRVQTGLGEQILAILLLPLTLISRLVWGHPTDKE